MGYLGAGAVDLTQILISIGITFFILITVIILFNRIEKTFMDTV